MRLARRKHKTRFIFAINSDDDDSDCDLNDADADASSNGGGATNKKASQHVIVQTSLSKRLNCVLNCTKVKFMAAAFCLIRARA